MEKLQLYSLKVTTGNKPQRFRTMSQTQTGRRGQTRKDTKRRKKKKISKKDIKLFFLK